MKMTTHKIGDAEVLVAAEDHAHGSVHAIKFTAICGEITREGILTFGLTSEETEEHGQKKIDDFGRRLAEEAANHERTRLIKNKLLSGG